MDHTTKGGLDELLAALRAAGTSRSLAAGEVLCVHGEESTSAYVVISGHLSASVAGHASDVVVATHGPDALVGEVTALIGGARTATLTAEGPAEVSVVNRASLRSLFDAYPDAAGGIIRAARERTDRSRVATLLAKELQAPDGDAVAAIAQRVTWLRLGAGETLFEQGEPADAAYLVVSGRLTLTNLAGSDGERPPINVRRGGIVGEFGLLEDRARSATVKAVRSTLLARLSAADFSSITVDHTTLAMGLVRRILDRSGLDHTQRTTARTCTVAFAPSISIDVRDEMMATVETALARCGFTEMLSADGVDQRLDQPGLADVAAGSFGEVRLSELLHQSETDAEHVVFRLDGDDGRERWRSRTLEYSDQVVVVAPAELAGDDARFVEQLRSDVPAGIPFWLAVRHRNDATRFRGTPALLARFDADEVHHLRHGVVGDVERLARLAAGRGIGLVLSGGGARGHAHIGVFRVLAERGIPIDRVVGASMGSIVAGGIAQGLDPDRLEHDMKLGADKLLDYTVPVVSLIKGERIVGVLTNQFGDRDLADLPIPFSCVSTDLTTAEVVVHRRGHVATAIRTSVSIPGVLPPVPHGNHLLADGGVLDNLPVGVLSTDESIGTIIASDVAPPLGPTAKGDYGLSVSGWSVMRDRLTPRKLRRRPSDTLPGIAGTLMRSLLIGSSKSRDEHLASGAVDLYLALDLRGIALLDFAQVGPAARRGYEDSQPLIDAWLAEDERRPWRCVPHDR